MVNPATRCQAAGTAALLIAIVLILAGCETTEVKPPAGIAFSTGEELYNRGSWEEAVPFLEDAVRLEPDNSTYRSLLTDAKRKASTLRYESGAAFFQSRDLDRALADYDRAVALDPDNQKTQIARLQTRQLRDEMAAAMDEGIALLQAGEWGKAARRLEPVLPYSNTFPDVNEYYAQAKNGEGSSAFADQQFAAAIVMYEAALKIVPTYEPAQTGLKTARHEEAKRLFVKGEKDFRDARVVTALQELRGAHAMDPDYPNLDALIAEVTREVARKLYESGQDLEQQNLDVLALVRYEEALKLDPSLADAKTKVEELSRLADQNRTYKLVVWPFDSQGDDPGLSKRIASELSRLNGSIDRLTLLEYEEYKARSINPRRRIRADGHLKGTVLQINVDEQPVETTTGRKTYQSGTEKKRNPDYDRLVFDIEELGSRVDEAETALNERQRKERRIDELERKQRDLDRQIKNGLRDLERMNQQLRVLKNQPGREEDIRRSNARFDNEAARLRDLDRQKSSVNDEINDLGWGPGLFSLEREYERARSVHNSAKRALLDTPEYLEEPTYEDYVYEVRIHRIRSRGEVKYQIDDELLQEPLVRRSVKVNLNEEDEEVVQANAKAGVNSDPRVLPTADEIREKTVQDLLTKLVRQITKDLKQDGSRSLRVADRELAQGNRVAASNEAMYYYRAGGRLDPAKWESVILQETAFSIEDRRLHLDSLDLDRL